MSTKIKLNIELNLISTSNLTQSEKDKLIKDLKSNVKTNLEMMISDIPTPNHMKLLGGYTYDITVR